jgi:hypothetical protein
MMPTVESGVGPVPRAIVMTPVESGVGPVPRAIVMTPVEISPEPGSRTIKMTPGVIARIAVTDAVTDAVTVSVKFMLSGFDNFFSRAASIRTAVAAFLTQGPGITG